MDMIWGALIGAPLGFLLCTLLRSRRPKLLPARRCWYAQRGRWSQDGGRGRSWRVSHHPPEVVQGEHPADYIARFLRGEA
jgi:hypothetical protein